NAKYASSRSLERRFAQSTPPAARWSAGLRKVRLPALRGMVLYAKYASPRCVGWYFTQTTAPRAQSDRCLRKLRLHALRLIDLRAQSVGAHTGSSFSAE